MGEMADYFLEEVEQHEEDRWAFLHGKLSREDAYDRGVIDEEGTYLTPGDGRGQQAPIKTCRCCGTGGLHWEKFKGNWRLHDKDNRIHACKANPL